MTKREARELEAAALNNDPENDMESAAQLRAARSVLQTAREAQHTASERVTHEECHKVLASSPCADSDYPGPGVAWYLDAKLSAKFGDEFEFMHALAADLLESRALNADLLAALEKLEGWRRIITETGTERALEMIEAEHRRDDLGSAARAAIARAKGGAK